ncbi:PREDICTED: calmodulin-binding protein 60 D-like isoform X2 [Ipomoea nil]|uniref:calmodulin-binding protein 60 D-like isoform X2 n=1 Tax=Ipomoea nil TaxID=35883 RepID=UPI0009016678|nr:PREDICTED: calmodulin-binding protein 60 D-like isoform X2 [Ipomoea nil]
MKRSEADGDYEGSESSAPASKRRNHFTTLINELGLKLEPNFRRWVREEVEKAVHSYLRCSVNQVAPPSQSRAYQLHFDGELESTIFTASKVECADGEPLRIFLYDVYSKTRITSGPLASIKLGVVVVDGEFTRDGREDWTEVEFSNNIVNAREGRRPLLAGDLVIQLRNGVGNLGDINFTDNSSWIRSRKFRLGVRVVSNSGVREGVSKAFTVKDHRGELYKKHYPPFLNDEVWRLEKIAKDGASHRKLAKNGISSVKGLLRMYATSPSILREILGCGSSNNTWDKIIQHATTCVVNDNEWHMYRVSEYVALVFNSIWSVVGVILDGQNYLPVDKLDRSQMQMVEWFKQQAYRNEDNIVPLEDDSIIDNQSMVFLNHQNGLLNSLSLSQEAFVFPAEQDQLEMQMNSTHTSFSMPIPSSELQHLDQYGDPMPETSHRMQVFNPNLGNSLALHNFTCLEDDLASGGSLDPLDNLTAGNNSDHYQFGSSSWLGNGVHFNSNLEPVHPDFFFHVPSSTGKPKARWCKIRAVVKWKMVAAKKWAALFV